jgi:hypothetical protein
MNTVNRGRMTSGTIIIVWLVVLFFAPFRLAEAQQTGKIFRIGFLDYSTASGSAVLVDAFRQELSKLGWVEGKNIAIEYRFADRKNDPLPELAADLVRLKVDLIVVAGGPTAFAAKGSHYHYPHRDGERCGPRGFRFGCQSGAAGRQRHRPLEFSDRVKYQKARDTKGHSLQARPSWTSAAGGSQRITANERAQGCGCGIEAEIGGDRDSIRCERFRERF